MTPNRDRTNEPGAPAPDPAVTPLDLGHQGVQEQIAPDESLVPARLVRLLALASDPLASDPLASDPHANHWDVRKAAAQELGYEHYRSPEALEAMLLLAQDGTVNVRNVAARFLPNFTSFGEVNTGRVGLALAQLIKDVDRDVQRDAIFSLRSVLEGYTGTQVLALRSTLLDGLLEQAMWSYWHDSDLALGLKAFPGSTEALDALIKLTADRGRGEEDFGCQSEAIFALVDFKEHAKVKPTLIALLETSSDRWVRERPSIGVIARCAESALALAFPEDPEVLGLLLARLNGEGDSRSHTAATLYPFCKFEAALDALTALADDACADVRRSASEALTRIPETPATPKVLQAALTFAQDEKPDVRWNGAQLLRAFPDSPEALEAIGALAKSFTAQDRGAAAFALHAFQPTPAVTGILTALLADKYPHVREAAARALAINPTNT